MELAQRSLAPQAHNGLKLESFPSDVLERILNLDDMTRSVIRLWTSGSRVMRHKIQQSVLSMHFESVVELAFDALPMVLVDLRFLQSLVIRRGRNRMNCRLQLVTVLKSLSPTLETLILDFEGSHDICEPNPQLRLYQPDPSDLQRTENPDDEYVDLAKHFPRLQWLEFEIENSPCHSAHLLPPTLTRLKADLKIPDDAPTLPHWPNLTHLELPSTFDIPEAFWRALPQCLEHLDLSDSFLSLAVSDIYALLPRTLKFLAMPPDPPFEAPSSLQDLPRQLESLSHVNLYESEQLHHLPPGLLQLHCSTQRMADSFTPSHIRQLPRSLTSLETKLHVAPTLTAEDMPPALTHLKLVSTDNLSGDPFVTLLPYAHLRSLIIEAHSMSTAALGQLPANLTRLHVKLATELIGGEITSFPPLLQDFTLHVYYYGNTSRQPVTIGKLPETVTSVSLDLSLASSSFFHLPARLRTLKLGNLAETSSFDPQDSDTIARIFYLRKVAHEDGIFCDENLPRLDTTRPYGIFDLLPRTLTDLELSCKGMHNWYSTVWQSIPKTLKRLLIWSANALHPNTLDYLPFDSITGHLTIITGTVKDEHIKRLNPRLCFVELSPTSWLLSPACVPWIPKCMQRGPAWPEPVKEAYGALIKQRKACIDSGDRQGFHAVALHQDL